MKYQGKIYGKVAGKYIELDFPQDLTDFVEKLNKELDARIESAAQTAKQYGDAGMQHTAISSMAMAHAYSQIKEVVARMHPQKTIQQ